MNMWFIGLLLLLFCIGLVIAPYIWLFNCYFYLKSIDSKLSVALRNKK